jgi:hypothetical protein
MGTHVNVGTHIGFGIKFLDENIELRYGRGFKVRTVNDRSFLNLNQKRIFAGNPFSGYHAGVKEFVDKPTEVWFGNYILGTINHDTGLIEPSRAIMQLANNT